MVPKKRFFQTYISTITAVKTWCDSETSWLIAQAWWTIWTPCENLVKTWWISKTCSKLEENPGAFPIPGEFPKLGENLVNSPGFHQNKQKSVLHLQNSPKEAFVLFLWWNLCVLRWNLGWIGDSPKPGENLMKTWWISEHLVHFQNLVKDLVNFQKLGENLVISKTWWRPGYFQNLVKTWWICKTWWKLGECQNLVKTWWKPGEFTRCSPGFHQTNERNVLCTEGFWYNACCIPHPK